jgi:PAS domain S-box-containing protein
MKKKINILHLEDDKSDAFLINELLIDDEFEFKINHVENRDDFFHSLERESFDIILADYSLPGFDGLEALQIARKMNSTVPFIFVSGKLGEEVAVESLKSGATDYVLKQNLPRLKPSILRAIDDVKEKERLSKAENGFSRLGSVVQQAAEAIIITDLEGKIEYVNPAFEKITGYSEVETLGKNPRILKSGKQDGSLYLDLWNKITSGQIWRGTFINKKKDGSLYHESATIFPIRNKDNDTINYAAVKRDITSQVKLETMLQQSQKLEAIGQLAGGIAHDFNNVLSIINGYSELALLTTARDSKYFHTLSQISNAGKKAGNLIKRLMAFSRNQIIEPRIINLNDLIKEMEKMLIRLIGEDISLELKLEKKNNYILADTSQVEQVLINLVVNARDAINEKTHIASKKNITIKTVTKNIDQKTFSKYSDCCSGKYSILMVQDNGIGMEDKTKSRIFEPFYTSKEEGKGTGLGLSTVYGIVKQNDGFIDVESMKGKGATFSIFWPNSSEKEMQKSTISYKEEIVKGAGNILLVEDEDGVRSFISDALETLGYNVRSAADGQQALNIIKRNGRKVDLLITDVVMPNMGGIELVEKISEISDIKKTLFISGYVNNKIIKNGIKMKKFNLLQKPFTFHSLSLKVNEIMQN